MVIAGPVEGELREPAAFGVNGTEVLAALVGEPGAVGRPCGCESGRDRLSEITQLADGDCPAGRVGDPLGEHARDIERDRCRTARGNGHGAGGRTADRAVPSCTAERHRVEASDHTSDGDHVVRAGPRGPVAVTGTVDA